LGLGRNLQVYTTIQCGNFQLATECGRNKADRDFAVEMIVFAMKDGMFLDRDLYIEVPGRSATLTGLAFTGQPDSVTGINPGRYLD
jgi:hypothetical protein